MAETIGSTVDRTISYLFGGLLILAFIILTVFGMSQMEATAKQSTESEKEQIDEEVIIDLGTEL